MSEKIDNFRLAPTDEIFAIMATVEHLREEVKFSSKSEVREFIEKQRSNLSSISPRMDNILKRITDKVVALSATTEWVRRVQSILESLDNISIYVEPCRMPADSIYISGQAALIIAYLNGARATITLYEDRTETE